MRRTSSSCLSSHHGILTLDIYYISVSIYYIYTTNTTICMVCIKPRGINLHQGGQWFAMPNHVAGKTKSYVNITLSLTLVIQLQTGF